MKDFLLKSLTLSVVGYLYYHQYMDYLLKYEEGLCTTSFTGFCPMEKPYEETKQNTFERIYDKLVLNEDEESMVIKKYAAIEREIKTHPDCAIGVGYTTCVDINFRAVDLFKLMQNEIAKVNKVAKLVPQVHDKISEMREFLETFLYYFERGANAERVTDSIVLFDQILKEVEKLKEYKREMGGHSAVFALRAQKEGCKVYIAAQAKDFYLDSLKLNDERASQYLNFPHQDIKLAQGTKEDHNDIHFVFEYNEGDQILGYTAPRSNRFYFVNDPNGASLKQMEIYHQVLEDKKINVTRHMFGGYQLMQKLPYKEAEMRLKKLETLWRGLKAKGDHRIHVEFAHFSRLDFFQLFEKYAVQNSDSLGMNEQELIMLLDFWQGKLEDINQARDSKPDLEETLDQLKTFFSLAKEKKLPISRVHMHPYGSFILCYDTGKWENGRDAVIKSSLTTPKYCKMTEDLSDHIENYDIPERPMQFANPHTNEIIEVQRDNLTYDFQLSDQVTCHLQFFIKCRKMIKTAGMGDTISSTGFIYHGVK